MPINEVIFTRQALAETPIKVLKFLQGIGGTLSIRLALREHGYSRPVQDTFASLLQQAVGLGPAVGESMSEGDKLAKDATEKVEVWVARAFQVSHAALRYEHPEVHAHVFQGELQASRGFGALVVASLFLDRLDEIQTSPDRKATRKADHAALAKLTERGFGEEERERIRKLVQVAHSAIDSDGLGTVDQESATKALYKLRVMYLEWAEIAKVAITSRRELLRLGLVRRRKSSKRGAVPDPVEGPPIDVGKVSAPVVTASSPS